MPTSINMPMANGMPPTDMDSRGNKYFRVFTGLRLIESGAEAWPEMTRRAMVWGCRRRDGVLTETNAAGAVFEGASGNNTTVETPVYTAADWNKTSGWAAAAPRTPGTWHMADLGGAVFLFDGAGGTYFRSGHNEKLWYALYGQRCGCARNGRLFLGGFCGDSHAYDYAKWPDLFNAYADSLPSSLSPLTMAYPDSNWVWWSSAGADDALFWYNKTHLEGSIEDLLNMGTSGIVVMPFPGKLVRILSLYDGVAVYGENGAVLLREVDTPTPGFGVQPIMGWPEGLGVLAVDGDAEGHLGVATDGTLWSVEPGSQSMTGRIPPKAVPVGFKHLFDYADANPSVVKDPLFRGWFVGPDLEGEWVYVFKDGTLVRTNARPTAAFNNLGVWTGCMPATVPALDLISDTYAVTGGGVVAAVKLHGTWAQDTQVSLLFKRNGVLVETESVVPDTRGLASFNVAANEFRVHVHGDSTAGVKLERLEVFMGGLVVDSNARLRPTLRETP